MWYAALSCRMRMVCISSSLCLCSRCLLACLLAVRRREYAAEAQLSVPAAAAAEHVQQPPLPPSTTAEQPAAPWAAHQQAHHQQLPSAADVTAKKRKQEKAAAGGSKKAKPAKLDKGSMSLISKWQVRKRIALPNLHAQPAYKLLMGVHVQAF